MGKIVKGMTSAIITAILGINVVGAEENIAYRLVEVDNILNSEVVEGEYSKDSFGNLGMYTQEDKDETVKIGFMEQDETKLILTIINDEEVTKVDLINGEDYVVLIEDGYVYYEVKKESIFEYSKLEQDDSYVVELGTENQGVRLTFKETVLLGQGELELDVPAIESEEETTVGNNMDIEIIEVEPSETTAQETTTETTTTEEVIEVTTIESTMEEISTEEVVTNEIIPFEIEYIEDESLYEGEEDIKVEGVNGEKQVTTRYTYRNGELQGEPEIQEDIIKEPVNKVVHTGVMPIESVEEVTEYVDIEFEIEVNETDTLEIGVEEVIQEGVLGRKKITTKITKVKGEVVGEPEVIEEVELEPINKIIKKGTYEKRETIKTVEEEEIPYETIYKDNGELAKGEEKVDVEGVVGLKRITHAQDYVNNVPTGEPKKYEEVITEPVNKVIFVGIREDIYIEEIKREEEIPFDTEYKEDANMYEGEEVINIEGVNGNKLITVTTTYLNGEQQGEPEIREEVLTEAVNQVIFKGTKPSKDIKVEEREEEIDFKVEEYTDKRVKKGERHLVQKGVKGLKSVKTIQPLEKGIPKGEPTIEETIIRPAKPEVYLLGIKEEAVSTTVKEVTTEKKETEVIKTGDITFKSIVRSVGLIIGAVLVLLYMRSKNKEKISKEDK